MSYSQRTKDIIKYSKAGLRFFFKHGNSPSRPFVLMYHRILRDPEGECFPVQPGLFVTEKTFNMHLEYLKANFKIIHVKELLERYFDGESLHNCCAISFDDGWRDNYYYAFPLLKKHSIPSSFFFSDRIY
jgi:peptidoglycan/xylan/chitin deacetylase (PgdA/CDA1 family)